MPATNLNTVITVALNGPTNPLAPWNHAELAKLAVDAHSRGAAIVHVHLVDEVTGEPTTDFVVASHLTWQEIARRTRVLVEPSLCVATPGGRESLREELVESHVRLAALDPRAPAIIGGKCIEAPSGPRRIAEHMRGSSVKPVFEISDAPSLVSALELFEQGLAGDPPLFSLCTADLTHAQELPEGSQWETRHFGLAEQALELGGHLHVALTDLDRAVELALAAGRPPASVDDVVDLFRIPDERRALLVLRVPRRRSGRRQTVDLTYHEIGEGRVVVVGSGAGSPTHPDWALNLQAHPEVHVTIDGRDEWRVARWSEGDERDNLWELIMTHTKRQLLYQRKAGRVLPVIVLEPQR